MEKWKTFKLEDNEILEFEFNNLYYIMLFIYIILTFPKYKD